MYRDLGHGQPRYWPESRLESLMEKLKMLGGQPLELLHDCLNPEKNHLHLTSKKPWTIPFRNLERTIFNWAEVFVHTYKCYKQDQSHLQFDSDHTYYFSNLWNEACLKFEPCISVSECIHLCPDKRYWTLRCGWFLFIMNFKKTACVTLFTLTVKWALIKWTTEPTSRNSFCFEIF